MAGLVADQVGSVPPWEAWREGMADIAVMALHAKLRGLTVSAAAGLLASTGWGNWLDGMLFAPRSIFRFYIPAVAAHLSAECSSGDFEAAVTFLVLLNARTCVDPESVLLLRTALVPVVDRIALAPWRFASCPDAQAELCARAGRVLQRWTVPVRKWQPAMSEG